MRDAMSVSRSPPSSFLHRRVSVETPEHVRLDYELADVGSRAAAIALDLSIMVGSVLLLSLALGYAIQIGGLGDALAGPVLILGGFVLTWGYFTLFEGLDGGRTPGKRVLGLRVIHVGGESLSFRGALLRNLLRMIDLQPVLTGLTGAVAILGNRRAQRLGDMVAGTVVVRDAGGNKLPGADALPDGRVGRPLLSAEQFDVLGGYLARRGDLEPFARRRVSASVVRAMGSVARRFGDGFAMTADELLQRLYDEEAPRHAAHQGGASLQAAQMARERAGAWNEYVNLVEKGSRRGLTRLTEEEVRIFGRLYRGVTADLARAQTYGASHGLLGTLRRWAGAGHNLLYQARARTAVSLGRWVWVEFPRSVRRHGRLIVLATACLFTPAGLTWTAVREDPLLGRALVAPGMLTRAENTEKNNPDARYLEAEVEVDDMPMLASSLLTNNIQVTFLAFAGGILAGLGTLWILIINGIVLGSVMGAYHNEGVLMVILAFVSPHGYIELAAICIAGGTGLGLGSALLDPGRRTRAAALRERGHTYLALLGGTSLMLVIAGVVEGFYSPSSLSAMSKFIFGAVTGLLMTLYFSLAGRRPDKVASHLRPNPS